RALKARSSPSSRRRAATPSTSSPTPGSCASPRAGSSGDGVPQFADAFDLAFHDIDRKSTRLNSSHQIISYAVFCLKKKRIKYTSSKKTKRQETDKHAKEFERNTNTVNQGYKAHRYSQSRGD